jgi:hypothetical protein
MGILNANLRQLYQRWGTLLFVLFLGGVAFNTLLYMSVRGREEAIPYAMLMVFILSLILTSVPVSVMTLPLAYCLPGHRTIPAKFVFLVGGGLCSFFAIPSLLNPQLAWVERSCFFLPVACTYSIFYWLGAATVFRFHRWPFLLCLLPLVGMSKGTMLGHFMATVTYVYPLPVMAVAVVIHLLAYRLLWHPHLVRRYCGQLRLGTFDAWNCEQARRYQREWVREEESKREVPSYMWGEATVLRYLRQFAWGHPFQAMLGGIYRGYGRFLLCRREWGNVLVMYCLVTLFLGYFGPSVNMVYAIPLFMVSFVDLQIDNTYLIAGGRCERFYTGVGLVGMTMFVVLAALTTMVGFSYLVAPYMPELTIGSQQARYQTPEIGLTWVTFLLVPLGFIFNLVFRRSILLQRVLPMMVFILLLQFLGHLDLANKALTSLSAAIGAVTLLVWFVFFAILSFICKRRCLGMP